MVVCYKHTLMHMCVLSRSVMSDSLLTAWTVAFQAPLSMGILQARILEWLSMPSSRGSFQPRDQTQVSHIAGTYISSNSVIMLFWSVFLCDSDFLLI